jgi:hypothetical protein
MTKMNITILAAILLCACGQLSAGNPPSIATASINSTTNQLIIQGQNLTPSPTVTLGVIQLTVVTSTATKIVASVPANLAPGAYLLRVTVASQNGFFVAVDGAQGPAGPTGPQGPQGPAGTVTLPFLGQVTSGGNAFEVDQVGLGGTALYGLGGYNDGSLQIGGSGLAGQGGATVSNNGSGGSGVYGQGGNPVAAATVGGYGGQFYGGTNESADVAGGAGVFALGGDTAPNGVSSGPGQSGLGVGGDGGDFYGGGSSAGPTQGGIGVVAVGGATGTNAAGEGVGGDGIDAYPGPGPSSLNYGLAGYFAGNVFVNGNLAKSGGSFLIDHPTDPDPEHKYLLHSFVESPDMMNIYNGNVATDGSGTAVVKMPEWFEALNRDFRYQLTVIGQFAQAIVASEISGGSFVIRTDRPGVKVSWQVTGIRQDAWANAHRIPLEVEKQAPEQGHYLHPELFGHGGEPDVHEVRHPRPAMKQR